MAEKQEQEAIKTEEVAKPEDTKQPEGKVEGIKAEGKVADDTDVIDVKTDENAEGYKPLFDEEEDFSEADLTGIDDEKPPEKEGKKSEEQSADQKADKEKEAAKKPDEDKAKEEAEAEAKAKAEAEAKEKEKAEAKAKAKEEAEKKTAKEKTDKKPPEGYVPHAALHETRELLKEEKAARKALEAKVEQLVAEKETPEPEIDPGFKVLTDLELEELIEEDPGEAIRYQNKLMAHNNKKAAAERAIEKSQREAESIVYSTVERIEKSVPGIYDDDSPVAKELADFAVQSGFKDEAFLEAMTNPATVIIPAGGKKSVLLGNGAASLIEMLHNVHKSSAEGQEKVDTEKIRSELTEEITKTLTEKITKELLAKLKPEHVPSEYRSIEELPGSQEAPVASTKQYTEAEFARLSEEEQERLLGG